MNKKEDEIERVNRSTSEYNDKVDALTQENEELRKGIHDLPLLRDENHKLMRALDDRTKEMEEYKMENQLMQESVGTPSPPPLLASMHTHTHTHTHTQKERERESTYFLYETNLIQRFLRSVC